jgi:riboflavin synthase
MFTGIIEQFGQITVAEHRPEGTLMTVRLLASSDNPEGWTFKIGESIAIDGVCTTIISHTNTEFTIEASPETLSKTTFGFYTPGMRVNLEKPVTPSTPLGGHFVTGHVDGTAMILSKTPEGISCVYCFRLNSPELAKYLIPKGSIAISGISLTVNTVEEDRFSTAIIPHTLSHTTLGDQPMGGLVNIETDLLGKYVHRLLHFEEKQRIFS